MKPYITLNVIISGYTYILEKRGALILVVVKLLLLSQVFVLCRLQTHGDHLCTGQHFAVFDCPLFFNFKKIFSPCVL